MFQTLKPFHCPSCSAPFCSKDAIKQHVFTKYPLLLPCHHSVCESCLQAASKSKTNYYVCVTCKNPVDLPHGKESVCKLHPDVHALGIINANRKGAPSLKVKMGPSLEMMQSSTPKSPSKSAMIYCNHCTVEEALWQCDECQLNFCTKCFDKVHKKMKFKKLHDVKKIFAESYNTMVQEGCKEHKNKPIEFYCEKDDTLTCSHCMLVGTHIGHEVKSLVDKNKTCADDLRNVVREVSEIEKRLKYTEHLIGEVSTTENIDTSEQIKLVHDHFHKLHTMLQLRENYLISELESAGNIQNERFERMLFEVSSYQKDIASMKRDAELVIETPCLAISAPSLVKKLESFKSIPCYLLPILENAEEKAKIDLQLDYELDNAIENYGAVDYSVPPKFQLVPHENLPQNYCMDIPESFLAMSDVESVSATTLDNFSEDSLISPGSKYSLEASFKYRDINRRHPEKVMVSHIKDPSCFWVQRCSDGRKLNSISEALNRWCRSHEAQRNKPTEVERGQLYLVQFSADKKWYRGRIKRILERGESYEVPSTGMKSTVVSKENKTVKNGEVKVEVFYVDYGNTEVVSLNKLLNMQQRFLSLAGLAQQCSLVDIAPIGETWNVEAIKIFTKFVNYKQVIMTTYEVINNIAQVDLSQAPSSEIVNDVPVSVRDALVFQELAIFPAGKLVKGRHSQNIQKYLPPERLRANSEVSVIVSHVDNPYHFYVQQITTAAYLSSLIVEMTDTFSKDPNTLLSGIFAPRVGMVCAAMYSEDKQWYRAQVISLPGGANVEVQYVDFGNTEVVHHRFLKKLPDKFCKLNIQAIPCKLADVTYNQAKCWSAEAKEWLQNKTKKKQLTLKCLGFLLGENKSEAVLYFKDEDYEICVNALMVEEGMADSTGENSTEVRRKIEIIEPPVPPETNSNFLQRLSFQSTDEEPILPPATYEIKKPKVVKPFPKTDGKHIEVVMSHIEDPGSFYVRIADTEKQLKKLVDNMQKAYENFEINASDIVVGQSYAVFSTELEKWFRGTVLSKDENNIMVQFVDYGNKEDVPAKNVHKLLNEFTTDEEFAFHCELIGIIPAGGSSKWSYKSKEEFQDLVFCHETLHLTCKGGIPKEKKCLPVNLYLEVITQGGALAPRTTEYKSVAEELCNKGVALPLRTENELVCKQANLSEVSLNKFQIETNMQSLSAESQSSSQTKTETTEEKEKESTESPDEVILSEPSCSTNPEDNSKTPPQKSETFLAETFTDKFIFPSEEAFKPPKPVVPKFKWKPVVYPDEDKFKGFITNIGEDGCLQLHVQRDGTSVVEMIKKALQFKYSRTPYDPLEFSPPVGEGCIAKFPIDNLWYRAEIVTIYENKKVKVNFVDYGNNEIIPLKDIRTDIIMQTFAKQCLECTMYGIHTGKPGVWDDDLLNFLHSQLVETIVEVQVMGPPDEEGKLPCKFITACGVSVTDLLQSMGFMDDLNEEPEQEFKTFQKASELKEGDIFPVCVSHIDSPNVVFLQRLKIPEPKSDYEKEHNKEHDAFLELVCNLQDQAEKFPLVKEPMPGMACCAKYSHDNQWYRCEIIDLTEDGAVVLFVDYGNSEIQPAENLRMPDIGFIAFPMQIHFCKIHGMAPVGEDWDPKVKEFMINALCLSGKEIFAKVVVPGKMSEIELMVKDENGDMKRVYEELIETNLITIQKTP